MIELIEFIVGLVLLAAMYSLFVVIPYAIIYKVAVRIREIARGG